MRSEDDRNKDLQDAVERRTEKAQREKKDVGSALRNVYREAVSEDVPDEMLDLLDKLK
ncbi:NepR family anti-sigma factor [Stakelama saccharophila]|uniref:NepR family anti-sigma factor n=1 Tax=Stakelama saccharophila TaxID=3075605 RepID=A0ABZ0BC84_9SPHN|nr:NepR family anti-sigma factor [Stakelama sp. W311]WNO54912.1 NepR family anti-sigma factor [Stakelama sp. W311]